MNRQQRRRSARKPMPVPIPLDQRSPATPKAPKPSLLVRLFARLVLSEFVLRRIHHPAARSALALVAREVGRQDLARRLES